MESRHWQWNGALEDTVLSDQRQTRKDKYCTFFVIWSDKEEEEGEEQEEKRREREGGMEEEVLKEEVGEERKRTGVESWANAGAWDRRRGGMRVGAGRTLWRLAVHTYEIPQFPAPKASRVGQCPARYPECVSLYTAWLLHKQLMLQSVGRAARSCWVYLTLLLRVSLFITPLLQLN